MAKIKPRTATAGKPTRQLEFAGKSGSLGKLWKGAKEKVAANPSPFINVDDGTYAAFLKKCDCLQDDSSRLVVDFGFIVASGDNQGQKISRRTYLVTEQNFEFFQKDLARLEVDINDLNIESEKDLKELCAELQKAALLIRLKLKTGDAGYQNVFFQKLLERDAAEPEAAAEEAASAGGASDADPEEVLKTWVGKQAAFKKGNVMFTGKVTKVDIDHETFTMKTNEGKTVTGDLETLEEVATGEDGGGEASADGGSEEVELKIDDDVEFEVDGKTLSGKVMKIAEDGTSAKVLVVGKTGKIKHDVAVSDLVIVR